MIAGGLVDYSEDGEAEAEKAFKAGAVRSPNACCCLNALIKQRVANTGRCGANDMLEQLALRLSARGLLFKQRLLSRRQRFSVGCRSLIRAADGLLKSKTVRDHDSAIAD
jgi:hypothetical protein